MVFPENQVGSLCGYIMLQMDFKQYDFLYSYKPMMWNKTDIVNRGFLGCTERICI